MNTLNKVFAIICWIGSLIFLSINWYILTSVLILGGIGFWYDLNFDIIQNNKGNHLIMWYSSKQSRQYKILFSW